MSRGFVKEDDLELAGTDIPERPISEHPNYVTPNGLKQLEQMVEALSIEHKALLPENEDATASQKLASIERDLRYYEARLEQAILVSPASEKPTIAVFGTTVSVEDKNGEQHRFNIVGEDEADARMNKVSYISPLAKALIGHKVDETVIWKRPAGDLTLEIIDITY
jgi:transcription elongation GreA/GreB family factor